MRDGTESLLPEDHAELDGLFAAVAVLPPGDLSACARRIARTMSAHFAREEALMARVGFPGLACHTDMHAALLAAIDDIVARADTMPPSVLAATLGEGLPRLVAHHEEEVDRITASHIVAEPE